MSVFSHHEFDNHQQVAFLNDPESGLKAIIAVHNTNLGPALGGCRMWPYISDDEALTDVLRLSRGMTYKSALANLQLGGGKAVIIGDPARDKTDALLHAMGDFIEGLGGRYITAEDSGTSVADMLKISAKTGFVSGANKVSAHGGDPSPSTAYGVFVSLREAVYHKLGRTARRRTLDCSTGHEGLKPHAEPASRVDHVGRAASTLAAAGRSCSEGGETTPAVVPAPAAESHRSERISLRFGDRAPPGTWPVSRATSWSTTPEWARCRCRPTCRRATSAWGIGNRTG